MKLESQNLKLGTLNLEVAGATIDLRYKIKRTSLTLRDGAGIS